MDFLMESEMPHEPEDRQCSQVGPRDQCKELEPLPREEQANTNMFDRCLSQCHRTGVGLDTSSALTRCVTQMVHNLLLSLSFFI
jgi:hypothetical protein